MDITLRIKDVGDAKLYLQPKKEICENNNGKANEFVLVRCQEDFENPYMSLQIDEKGNYEIFNERAIDEDQ